MMHYGPILGAGALLCVLSHGAAALDPASLKADQITIRYEPPTDLAQHERIYQMLKENRVLERFKELLAPVRLPRPLLLQLKSCGGEENAWYDYEEMAVTVCYDLIRKNVKDAPKKTTPAGVSPEDAVIGPVAEIFLHETGHAVFDLLEVPILGHEEDAADQFAAYVILQFPREEARRLIAGIAYMYGTIAKERGSRIQFGQFADEHGQPAQRYFTYVCLAYGADSTFFAELKEKAKLPPQRADQCEAQYDQAQFAFKKLITPYVDPELIKRAKQKKWLRPLPKQ